MLSVPVPAVTAVLLVTTAFVVLGGLRNGWRLMIGLALGGGMFALGLLFGSPTSGQSMRGPEPQNVSQQFLARDVWLAHRDEWGEPIGAMRMMEGFLEIPFRNAVMRHDPGIDSSYWATGAANVVEDVLLPRWDIAKEANPITPTGLALFLEAKLRAGIDVFYFYGAQTTSPVEFKGGCLVAFQKQALWYPCQSVQDEVEMGQITRLPVGESYWCAKTGCADVINPDPWTTMRKLMLGAAVSLLLVSGIAVRFFGYRFSESL